MNNNNSNKPYSFWHALTMSLLPNQIHNAACLKASYMEEMVVNKDFFSKPIDV
jgi:hypothetical protein